MFQFAANQGTSEMRSNNALQSDAPHAART
jgi:hypothetical protein